MLYDSTFFWPKPDINNFELDSMAFLWVHFLGYLVQMCESNQATNRCIGFTRCVYTFQSNFSNGFLLMVALAANPKLQQVPFNSDTERQTQMVRWYDWDSRSAWKWWEICLYFPDCQHLQVVITESSVKTTRDERIRSTWLIWFLIKYYFSIISMLCTGYQIFEITHGAMPEQLIYYKQISISIP